MSLLNERVIHSSFGSVAATLQELDLRLTGKLPAVLRLWSAIRLLTRLVSLELYVSCFGAENDWDLSVLSALPALERAWIRFQYDRDDPVCTPEQVEALSQCMALTRLCFGRWLPKVPRWFTDEPPTTLPLDGGDMIEPGLATLMQRRKENGATPLRNFYLGNSVGIESNAWEILSQLTELEKIEAFWSSTLTAEEWSRLAKFQQLQVVTIKGFLVEEEHDEDWHALACVDHLLSALTHCPLLRSLTLEGGFDLHTEHVALIARFPSLHDLSCNELHLVESLQPLAAAPALTELSVKNCNTLNDQPINFRQLEMISPMPLVSKLTIGNSRSTDWMRKEEAEPLIVALMQRLPRLTREELHRY